MAPSLSVVESLSSRRRVVVESSSSRGSPLNPIGFVPEWMHQNLLVFPCFGRIASCNGILKSPDHILHISHRSCLHQLVLRCDWQPSPSAPTRQPPPRQRNANSPPAIIPSNTLGCIRPDCQLKLRFFFCIYKKYSWACPDN